MRPKAIRRLVIWYRRNSAVTSLVDTATSSASVAGNVAETVVSSAGSVVSSAGSVVSSAGSMALSTLEPLVFDPLRRLQGSQNNLGKNNISDSERLWVAVDGMGGDLAPGPILEGCLKAIERLPLRIKFVGEYKKIEVAAAEMGLEDLLNQSISKGHIELIPSGPSVGMDEDAMAVRRKRDASINLAMDLVKKGEALAVYSAGNSGALMASAIFRLDAYQELIDQR